MPRIAEDVTSTPDVCGGGPCVAGTRIETCIIFQRFKRGESINELAVEYCLTTRHVENAVRYELVRRRSAATVGRKVKHG